MRSFDIDGMILHENDPALQQVLERAWRSRIRPRCLCKNPGVATYIARIGDQFMIKRMPLSGENHDPACEAHELPWTTSGLTSLLGSAIRRDEASGGLALRLGFGMAKVDGRNPASTTGLHNGSRGSVTAQAQKLSLVGLLQLLWHEAELTRWTSNWTGKRGWWTVRSHLQAAARTMTVRGAPLANLLFIPETFRLENKTALEQRRTSTLAPLLNAPGASQQLMLMLGEVKSIDAARVGRRIVIKHLPDFPVLMDDRAWARVRSVFSNELALSEADDANHLIMLASFGLNAAGLATVVEIVLMVTTLNWIPFRNIYEYRLLAILAKFREESIRKLSFGTVEPGCEMTALLPHRQPKPLALYILPPGTDEVARVEFEELLASRPELESWIWDAGAEDLPQLPVA